MSAKKSNFETAIKKLEDIVSEMETGELSLEESVKKFEEGIKLSKICSDKLNEAEEKISLLAKEHELKLKG
ncbi:MAG: exodeoxyribonuclease VII small subunit [Deltaproteobacteria bacterium]|jgi:exodeoxyribonuclease VII small subunit|nr:exodeoxyribonuclease VII small subunit [Deltaproteobacteria bacterium]